MNENVEKFKVEGMNENVKTLKIISKSAQGTIPEILLDDTPLPKGMSIHINTEKCGIFPAIIRVGKIDFPVELEIEISLNES